QAGNTEIYNGTFTPYLSTYNPGSQSWSHQTFAGWSTVNNGSYGGIAAFDKYVFVTDMNTNGASEQGIVRFDITGGPTVRFADTNEYIDVIMGLDGNLYGLTGGNHVFVFNPTTLAPVRDFGLSAPGSNDTRAIAVDAVGNVFAGVYSTAETVLKIDPTGSQVLAQISLPPGKGAH